MTLRFRWAAGARCSRGERCSGQRGGGGVRHGGARVLPDEEGGGPGRSNGVDVRLEVVEQQRALGGDAVEQGDVAHRLRLGARVRRGARAVEPRLGHPEVLRGVRLEHALLEVEHTNAGDFCVRAGRQRCGEKRKQSPRAREDSLWEKCARLVDPVGDDAGAVVLQHLAVLGGVDACGGGAAAHSSVPASLRLFDAVLCRGRAGRHG